MKHLYTLAFVLATVFAACAQTPWYLTGNTPVATDFLGSTNQQDLNFNTFNN